MSWLAGSLLLVAGFARLWASVGFFRGLRAMSVQLGSVRTTSIAALIPVGMLPLEPLARSIRRRLSRRRRLEPRDAVVVSDGRPVDALRALLTEPGDEVRRATAALLPWRLALARVRLRQRVDARHGYGLARYLIGPGLRLNLRLDPTL